MARPRLLIIVATGMQNYRNLLVSLSHNVAVRSINVIMKLGMIRNRVTAVFVTVVNGAEAIELRCALREYTLRD